MSNAVTSGHIQFNDMDPQSFYKNGSIAYVQQQDHLMPYLTVRETLRYAAELRLDRALSKNQKYELVEQVILELGIGIE